MRVAIVADVHGNLRALQAVATELRTHSPDLVVNLGDHVSGPIEPTETADLLMSLNWPSVRGNHDRNLVYQPIEDLGESDQYALSTLRVDQLKWLSQLPATLVIEDLFLCHGTPSSDSEYLLDAIGPCGSLLPAPDEFVTARIASCTAAVILCGHSHVPSFRRLGKTLIVNPGSVGLQAYQDDHPSPHTVQTCSPSARFGILDQRSGEWIPTLLSVEYDWKHAADCAVRQGRTDWAEALLTGYVSK